MSERDVDARVEKLTWGLRRMAAELLEAAAEHPDAVRARELSAAARVLTNNVLARLDGEAVEDSPSHRSEPEVQDTVPSAKSAVSESGTALDELVELYLPDYARRLDDPVMTDPDLPYERWNHLHRVRFGRGKPFEDAPLWNDAVPSRGKAVVRGMTSQAEVLQGCEAIRRSRAIDGGDFVDKSDLTLKLDALQWHALVIAACRSEHARA
ncbi:hypothetical protein [Streptomyces sp. NPDC057582]|uniref:hypothetical protein n=1 Tax=Streptomyces sp. NPDC057582 TaxID=3346174 RepID=UPI00368D383A